MKVKWVTPCEYQLSFINMIRNDTVTADGHKVVVEDKGHGLLNIDITTVAKDYYVFSAKEDSMDFRLRDTAWIYKIDLCSTNSVA